jgi:anti-sigma factor RsiW
MTCSIDNELGAYVLDALEPDESEAVRAHLIGCPVCRAEVRRLADTAALLALLTAQDIELLFGPKAVTGDTTPTRPRPRRGAWAAAAALLIGATTLGAARMVDGGPGRSPPGAVQVVDPATHVHAAVMVSRRSWGTQVHLALAGAYPRGSCSLVAHSRDGRSESAATWVADSKGAARVDAVTAIRADQLNEIDIMTTAGVQLVRINLPGDGE